jgi:hypothetical protein
VGRVFALADAEREHISEVVEMTDGLITGEGGAAEVLGVPPSTLRKSLALNLGGIRQPRRKEFEHSPWMRGGRGRDNGCPLPPAQTRAGAIDAHGSYLGWVAAKRTLG